MDRTEELLWLDDGFSSGVAQVGRKINIKGKTEIVIDGSELTIKVMWNTWYTKFWRKIKNEF